MYNNNKTNGKYLYPAAGIQLFKEQFHGYGRYSVYIYTRRNRGGGENVNKVTKFMFLNRSNEIFRVKKPTHTRWPRGQVNLLLGGYGGGVRGKLH